ncbi:tRNA (guanine(9)-N(1))-methyltransferase [Malassezia cuniculi]|uniref:tRNA (guanine(9)-N1)-methyltransferase n=1 Tax=Malassezia cuniculi TaxID=948313 RepID=A0AAF0J839_9BASI|nr:tRNA (guanine(9)-N(1))-methyltransferase [Malassezia cuniculi]
MEKAHEPPEQPEQLEHSPVPDAPHSDNPKWRPPIVVPPGMTKSAAKKMAKRAAREEYKQATKHDKRAKERARRKERRALLRTAERPPRVPRPPPQPFPARVVVDLGFDDLMTADEATSMAAQLGYLYSVNKASSHPFHEIVFAGAGTVSGRSLGFKPPVRAIESFPDASTSETSIFDDRVGKHMEEKSLATWRRWSRVKLVEKGGIEALWTRSPSEATDAAAGETEAGSWAQWTPCDKSQVIYLTADTDETISEMEPGMTYVIGGIVDRNRYKNLCAKKAAALGLQMRRLPIDPAFLGGQGMSSRKVLTVNQVFAILVGWTETRDWTQALQRGLPSRKFNTPQDDDKASDTHATTSTLSPSEETHDECPSEAP